MENQISDLNLKFDKFENKLTELITDLSREIVELKLSTNSHTGDMKGLQLRFEDSAIQIEKLFDRDREREKQISSSIADVERNFAKDITTLRIEFAGKVGIGRGIMLAGSIVGMSVTIIISLAMVLLK